MKEKINYLSKNVLLFMLSSFLPKLLALLLIKLYTNYLSTADYGISDLMNTTSSLLIPLLTIDIQDAVLRFGLDEKYKKSNVLMAGIRVNAIALLVAVLLVIPFSFFRIFEINNYYYIFLIVYFASTSLKNTLTFFCKTIEKINTIVVSSIISSLVIVLLNILLLVVFDWGVVGYLTANVAGLIVSNIYIFINAKLYKYITFDKTRIVREMIIYSWPLVFNSVSWWINDVSDRYILTSMAGVAISGIYAISYKIPGILSSLQTIFYQAWSISAIKEFDKDDSDGFIGKMYTMMNFCMCAVCSIIMILNKPIANFLYSGEFAEAWKFVPPLLISVVFNAMSLFIGGIFTAVKDTKAISVSTALGAIINIVLNLILIRIYSAYGAALATLIGNLFVIIMRNIILKKYIKMNTNMIINWTSYILLSLQMILAYFGNKYLYFEVTVFLVIILLYRESIKTVYYRIKKLLLQRIKSQ